MSEGYSFSRTVGVSDPFGNFDGIFHQRVAECDEFYKKKAPESGFGSLTSHELPAASQMRLKNVTPVLIPTSTL